MRVAAGLARRLCDDRAAMWAALLGAVVGGFFALAGGFSVEFRRERRRQIAAARLVLAEFTTSAVDVFVEVTAEQTRVAELDPAELDEAERAGWLPGPHPKIKSDTWLAHAAEFVGALEAADFDLVDRAAAEVHRAGVYGFYIRGANELSDLISGCTPVLEPLTKPTWVDRHVWRL
jgi:hypothetical protein